jgi:ArsR family transcriptional regulator, arsenate/arsenite/antimonite-responsive transcriptional repressor
MMELDELASCLEKLGNATRLAIFRLLVRAGPDGLPVGEVKRRLGIPPSTLSHHILFLVTARLIRQEREGRILRCKANYPRMNEIVESLKAECCADVDRPAQQRGPRKAARRAGSRG